MWRTILLSAAAGLVAGNAVPHFVKGITRETYPNVLGNGPVPNVISGWAGLVAAALLFYLARAGLHPLAALISVSVGVLCFGLFHAGPGAFGRKSRT